MDTLSGGIIWYCRQTDIVWYCQICVKVDFSHISSLATIAIEYCS